MLKTRDILETVRRRAHKHPSGTALTAHAHSGASLHGRSSARCQLPLPQDTAFLLQTLRFPPRIPTREAAASDTTPAPTRTFQHGQRGLFRHPEAGEGKCSRQRPALRPARWWAWSCSRCSEWESWLTSPEHSFKYSVNSAHSQNASSAVSEDGVSGEGCSFLYQPLHQKEAGNKTISKEKNVLKFRLMKVYSTSTITGTDVLQETCKYRRDRKKPVTSFIREKY